MKKHIANIITVSRIIFSIPLLFIPLSSRLFYVFYLFCGITDMIDGTIARKMGTVSSFGTRLDTVADFIFVLVCGVKMLPLLRMPAWLWTWIVVIFLAKIFNIVFVVIRRKNLISIHSALNKITGFSLFLLPPTLPFLKPTYSVATICALATLAVMQEVCFMAKGQEVV